MPKKPPLPSVMFSLAAGRWVTHMLYVAARLEIADLLKDGPRTVGELATAAGAQPDALYRVLRALASLGIFAEIRGKRFKLTPLAATLRKDVPGSMRAMAIMMGEKYQCDSWSQLLHGVRTGEVPFLKAHGVHYFRYLEDHPEDFQVFSEAMTSVSATENRAIAAAYPFSRFGTVMDVGGGNGSLLAAILKANRKLKAVLFDLPTVSARARESGSLTVKGIEERCAHEEGSFFEGVPKGADAYLMKRVLHDWDDPNCVKILANCRAAMNENGAVLVIDSVIAPGNAPDRGKLLDLQMFTIGGRERTKAEFAELFGKAGLKLARVVQTNCPLSIVEGVRA